MRHHSPRSGLFRRWLTTTTALAGFLPLLGLTVPAARANPEGGSVVQGAATITQTDPKTVTVNQTTDKAVINWRSFSIGADETTRFNQPSSSSTTLNRVTGDQVSKILGNLSANGKVFLVNPNGIVFGAGSKIDVAALVASTADIKNDSFMAGNLRFDIPGNVGAEIINQGTITAADGGLVALVSPVLRNSGIIQARLGKVALASTAGVTLDLYGDNLILFQAADKVTEQMVDTDGKPVSTAIDNSGEIYADGGRVLMTANTAKGVVDNAINTTGLVSARAVEQQGGEIVLKGEDGGNVQVAGTLDASGNSGGQTGGTVHVLGEQVGLVGDAVIDVSGDSGGGVALIGGDYLGKGEVRNSSVATVSSGASINADAVRNGNGGKVIVWSDEQSVVSGRISAKGGGVNGDGGFVETSSANVLELDGIDVNASAAAGASGLWFIDPDTLNVDGGVAASIMSALNNGTNSSVSATNDIYVYNSITKSSGDNAKLTLSSNFIYLYEGANIISTAGKLDVNLETTDRIWIGRGFDGGTSIIQSNGGDIFLHGPNFVGANGLIDAGTGNLTVKAENKNSTGVDKGIWIYGSTTLSGGTINLITSDTLRVDTEVKKIFITDASMLGNPGIDPKTGPGSTMGELPSIPDDESDSSIIIGQNPPPQSSSVLQPPASLPGTGLYTGDASAKLNAISDHSFSPAEYNGKLYSAKEQSDFAILIYSSNDPVKALFDKIIDGTVQPNPNDPLWNSLKIGGIDDFQRSISQINFGLYNEIMSSSDKKKTLFTAIANGDVAPDNSDPIWYSIKRFSNNSLPTEEQTSLYNSIASGQINLERYKEVLNEVKDFKGQAGSYIDNEWFSDYKSMSDGYISVNSYNSPKIVKVKLQEIDRQNFTVAGKSVELIAINSVDEKGNKIDGSWPTQCVNLVKGLVKGVTGDSITPGNGVTAYKNIAKSIKNKEFTAKSFDAGVATTPPSSGNIISFNTPGSSYGHVALVSSTASIDENIMVLNLLEQNVSQMAKVTMVRDKTTGAWTGKYNNGTITVTGWSSIERAE